VLDKGQVVGMGTHEELLETNSIYAEIYQLQLMDETVPALAGESAVGVAVGSAGATNGHGQRGDSTGLRNGSGNGRGGRH
jgi:hypothetical protein